MQVTRFELVDSSGDETSLWLARFDVALDDGTIISGNLVEHAGRGEIITGEIMRPEVLRRILATVSAEYDGQPI